MGLELSSSGSWILATEKHMLSGSALYLVYPATLSVKLFWNRRPLPIWLGYVSKGDPRMMGFPSNHGDKHISPTSPPKK